MSAGGGDPDLWAKIAGGFGTALAALGTWAWGHTHKRIEDAEKRVMERLEKIENKAISRDDFDAHAHNDEKVQGSIKEELEVQRGHIGKIYDQMRDMEQKGHERHVELLNAIHLSKKAANE